MRYRLFGVFRVPTVPVVLLGVVLGVRLFFPAHLVVLCLPCRCLLLRFFSSPGSALKVLEGMLFVVMVLVVSLTGMMCPCFEKEDPWLVFQNPMFMSLQIACSWFTHVSTFYYLAKMDLVNSGFRYP